MQYVLYSYTELGVHWRSCRGVLSSSLLLLVYCIKKGQGQTFIGSTRLHVDVFVQRATIIPILKPKLVYLWTNLALTTNTRRQTCLFQSFQDTIKKLQNISFKFSRIFFCSPSLVVSKVEASLGGSQSSLLVAIQREDENKKRDFGSSLKLVVTSTPNWVRSAMVDSCLTLMH